MILALIQVLFAAIRAVIRSSVNILLYSVFSRVFHQWFGLNSIISFFCSAYCLSKMVNYLKRIWRNARLKNKKADEKLVVDQLTWQSNSTMSKKQFENDWNFLSEDDRKNLFPSIVNIPFSNPWLFIGTMMIIDYQMNKMDLSYSYSLIRTLAFLIILICGSSIRYQTLFERERKTFLDLQTKHLERFLVYSNENSTPIASISFQSIDNADQLIFIIQSFCFNSKFDDYIYDVENFLCEKLIDQFKSFVQTKQKSGRIVWSIPSCRRDWTSALKTHQFLLRSSYADFAFMPLVKSHVEQYEFIYRYDDQNKMKNE